MMISTERMVQAAEANVRRECDAGIARIRAELQAEGEDLCVVCDEPIEAARKAALPSAERCISCQIDHERQTKREHLSV